MYTLSIILNLHRENELVQKTIENLNRILTTKNSWINIECIAILDNSNEETKSLIYKNKNIFHIIEEVNYTDLALSRNHGVNMATGNFILFADGDDYCSHNVLQSLYKVFYKHYHEQKNLEILEDNQHIAVFPENLVWFPKISKMRYYESNNFMVQNNKFTHCYISRIAIYKGLLKKYPIRTNTAPYGYEDWDLNNRLLENGVMFKISDYSLYYRVENHQSLLAGQQEKKYIVRNSDTFGADNINTNVKIENKIKSKSNVLNYIKYFFKMSKNNQKPSIEKDLNFLSLYNETSLDKENILFHSAEHYISHVSIQVEMYQQLLILLSTHHSAYLSDSKTEIKKDTLLLSIHKDIINWYLLSEDDQLHIFIKAIINSKVKTIIVGDSELGKKSLLYHHLIYKEYKINIRSIA